MIYVAKIEIRIGTILTMPLPNRLTATTIAIVMTASTQLVEALVMAELDRIRPMRMMIGPVTTGGNSFMIFFAPKIWNRAARITYTMPAHTTPPVA